MHWGEERKPWDTAFRELIEGDPLQGWLNLFVALRMEPGEWLPVASDALPELVRYVEDRSAPERERVLAIVERLAKAARVAAVDERWPGAWAAAVPRLLALLADPAAEIRRAAALALAPAPDPGGFVVRALFDRFGMEDAESVRVGLVVAIGELGGESVLQWLRERAGEDVFALAAWVSIARITGETPVDRLIEALCGDLAAYDGLHSLDELSDFLEWAAEFLTPPSQVEVLLALATRPGTHRAVFKVAVDLVTKRPSMTEALVPVFGHLLGTPERGRAAVVLAEVAPASAAYADRLFALIDDAAPAETLGKFVIAEVRDVALWALLRLRDRRAVAPQLARFPERMRGERLVAGCSWYPTPPGEAPHLRDLFGHAPEFADEVLPWVCDLLRQPVDAQTVLQVTRLLTDWGPVAAPAAPYLAPVLGSADPRVVEWCADALALIGVADEPVVAALAEAAHRTRLPWAARSAAATAFAVLGGDQAMADALLADGLARGEVAAVERLAALGPAAAHHLPAVRRFGRTGNREVVAVARALARLSGNGVEALPLLLAVLADVKARQVDEAEVQAVRTLGDLAPLPAEAVPVLRKILATDEPLWWLGGGILGDREFRREVARALAERVS